MLIDTGPRRRPKEEAADDASASVNDIGARLDAVETRLDRLQLQAERAERAERGRGPPLADMDSRYGDVG